MLRIPLPPLPCVVAFIDCINRGDVAGLERLMTIEHRLAILDEAPVVGRVANVEAWNGYFSAFPTYLIYPRSFASDGNVVTILGATTGSHLGLPDDEELRFDVIWRAEVNDGALSLWSIVAVEQHPGDDLRRYLALPTAADR